MKTTTTLSLTVALAATCVFSQTTKQPAVHTPPPAHSAPGAHTPPPVAHPSAPAAHTAMAAGTVVTAADGKLVYQPRGHPGAHADSNAADVTLSVDESTRIIVDGTAATLDDLKKGMATTITTVPATTHRPAQTIVSGLSSALSGVVEKIEPTQLTVTSASDGEKKQVVVTIDDKTQFVGVAVFNSSGQRLDSPVKTFDDVKVGNRVRVVPATGTATKVFVITATPQNVTTEPTTAPTTKSAT